MATVAVGRGTRSRWRLSDVDRDRQYASGDAFGCMRRWFSGRWQTDAAELYVVKLKSYLAQRIWERPSFSEIWVSGTRT